MSSPSGMLLSQLPFQDALVAPRDLPSRSTSSLLESGAFVSFLSPHAPHYLPLGKRVLDRLVALYAVHCRALGFQVIEIPAVMKNELLLAGQDVGEQFEGKLLYLDRALDGYHLLSSPEMSVVDLARSGLRSHHQLPMRFFYHSDFFRSIKRCRGILKARQFKGFVGTSLDADEGSFQDTVSLCRTFSRRCLERLRVPTSCVEDIMGSLYMHFYVGSEGDALDIPQIDPDRRVRAHGLTMCYRYPLPKHERPRFRDSRNKNARAIVGSYGITVTTAYWSIFDACRDELGFNLPPPVRPVTAVIIPQQRSDTEASLGLASELGASGASLAVDERRIDRGRKAAFSDFIGAPLKILVSGDGFRLRWRDGAEEPGSLEAARAALDRLAAEERVAAC